ncbi:MAG: transcription-repair coupling factor [Anaerolineae bacterium]|nr:transcription-repair coupling factor [Anaerolineae bacterium]
MPVRIEFFGDEIESLRRFDPSTQRSSEMVAEVIVTPAAEALPGKGPAIEDRLMGLDLSALHPLAQSQYARERDALIAGVTTRTVEFYQAYLHPLPATLIDYLPPNAWILLDDWHELATVGPEVGAQAETLRDGQIRAGELPLNWDAVPVVPWGDVERVIRARRAVALDDPTTPQTRLSTLQTYPFSTALSGAFAAPPRFGGQLAEAVRKVLDWTDAGQAVILVSRQADRLADLFRENGVRLTPVTSITDLPGPRSLTLVRGILGEGWQVVEPTADSGPPTAVGRLSAALTAAEEGRQAKDDDDDDDDRPAGQVKLTLLSDGELFGWRLPRRRRARQRQAAPPESFFSDLRPGDYVVHIEHGIGRFIGMVKMEVAGTEREYLEVEYARGDKLYVPTYQVDRVSRYIGIGDMTPDISRLGSTDWERVKQRAKRAVEELARELLELYAARETVQGHAFKPDTPWQAELEASFPHTETEDQLRVIDEVKADMEQPKPMDRLIAGDVGYGKTEVALRAAFKAVMDGKQVALLVPTTVLAQQHYTTFSQRLSAFPVTVACLSRLQNDREQTETLKRLAEGRVDIVIGTHRLLSQDVQFKDLGLVIIDEEQRFGVAHKERLKEMRQEVDVLTLTATPIPRTLHMSLSGLRDLSTIDTPPEERLPVYTVVAEYDDNLTRQAILRELDRGGQVYFVHNRVQGIQLIAQHLQRLVPEAMIGIAHGQMDENDLANVMLEFASGRIDILVCTSIIESGLDIPNANTLIVNRADKFGLAQLYQLRGRVGRSTQRAYAYLLYEKGMELSDESRRRLEAIMEVSDQLGGGFRLAMRDLEIRGAGDLLGSRQHGQIAAVGFDLYTRLLAQAIKEVRADQVDAAKKTEVETAGAARRTSSVVSALRLMPAPTIELPLDALLPDNYVPDESLRLRLYRRMSELDNLLAIDLMAQELADRFGPPPPEVQSLLYLLRVKLRAQQAGVHTIQREGENVILRTDRIPRGIQQTLQRRLASQAQVASNQVRLPMRGDWQAAILQTLVVLSDVIREWEAAEQSAAARPTRRTASRRPTESAPSPTAPRRPGRPPRSAPRPTRQTGD